MALPLSKIIFNKHDKDKSGYISAQEFKSVCYDLGHFLNDDQLVLAVRMIDQDGKGSISYDSFAKWWRSEGKFKHIELDEKQIQALNQSSTYFRYFDKDSSGSLDRNEFKALHADLVKNKLTHKTFDNCLLDLDTNNDGKIEFNEYIDWLIRIGSIPMKVL